MLWIFAQYHCSIVKLASIVYLKFFTWTFSSGAHIVTFVFKFNLNAVPHWPMQSGTFHFRLRTNVLSIIMAVHCWTILTSNRSLLCTLSLAQMHPQRTQMNIHFLWKVLLQYKTNKWYNTFRMHDTRSRCNFTLVKSKISSATPNTIMKFSSP